MDIFLRYVLSIIILLGSMAFCPVEVLALDTSHYASQSVLSSGRWVKVSVTETGIHYISNSLLAQWGFSDPSSVKIFGYGGAPVSTTLDENQIDDLPQVPVLRLSDRILFYAQGPTTWRTSSLSGMTYKQYQHPYATAGYYFITDRSDIQTLSIDTEQTALGGGETVTTFTDRVFHEEELYSPGETGNLLLGEDFRYSSTQSFSFNLDGLVSGSTVSVQTGFGAAASGGSCTLKYSYNGNAISGSDNIQALTSEYDHVRLSESVKQFSLSSESLSYSVSFSYSGTVSVARLDYITVNYTRSLDMDGDDQLLFRTPSSGSSQAVYCLSGCTSNTHIWDVTTSHVPVEVSYSADGSTAQFTPSGSGEREYVAFNENGSFSSPVLVGSVSNQDLHAEATPDMIIISPSQFLTEARRIASLHEQMDTMRVLVVDHSLIFNEFSSGTPDVMAYRKLAKMFYDRGTSSDGHTLGYMLLFGRALYDNRNITSVAQSLDYPRLLIWESDDGINEQSSFCSDDILACLSDGSSTSNVHTRGMDIAIGRMPVKDTSEADDVIDKLEEYVYNEDLGSWKNNIIVLADDGDQAQHMQQAENGITQMIENGGENYVYNRIYTDAYTLTDEGSGSTYPEARKQMFKLLTDGAFVFNYVGHGSPVGWSHESMLTWDDINNSLYYSHIPLFFTATCEFSRVDASSVSGGELMFLNERGGGIAMYSTTRVVYISNNADITYQFCNQLFKKDSNGNYQRVGDIYRLSKNSVNDTNKLRYILLGDPAMRLGYPTYHAEIETINGIEPTEENMPEFMACQTITVRGSIYDSSGNKDTSFNGAIFPTLYDAERSVETNGNQDGVSFVYDERSNKLAVIKDSISNGEFVFQITIPSEVSADNYRPAELNLYAYSDDGKEANGSNSNFYIYGYDETAANDTIGPNIRSMYLNSEDFTNGDKVNESPLLIAEVYDSSGLNFSTSGIGHQMTLLLDGTTTYSDVSSYFTPEIAPDDEDGAGGFIYYPLEDLEEGVHTLRLRVWDVFANSSERTISFNVVNGLAPNLYEVYATPNPASTEANFYLKHNRPDASITVTIYVYNLMGQLVWSAEETGRSDMFTSFPVTWDLTDFSGRRVQRGVYVYRAGISTDGVQTTTASRKIAITAEP